VLGGVLLLGMAVTAGYAARVLPAGARVPVNAGVPEHSVWLPKRAGLAAWFGVGVAAFALFALLTVSGLAANWAQSVRVVLLPCVMTVVLAAEAGAVIVARRSAVGEPAMDLPKRTPGTSGSVKAYNTNTPSDDMDDLARFGDDHGSDHDTVTSDQVQEELRRPGVVVRSVWLLWDRCSRQCLEGPGLESTTPPKTRAADLLSGITWPCRRC
jgi:hypothetical protein